jgi:hypothetical protein
MRITANPIRQLGHLCRYLGNRIVRSARYLQYPEVNCPTANTERCSAGQASKGDADRPFTVERRNRCPRREEQPPSQ